MTSRTGATVSIGSACTNYTGGAVTITVPSNGTIVVQAQVWIIVNHSSGTQDTAWVSIGTAKFGCSALYVWPVVVPSAQATGTYSYGAFPQLQETVTAGTYTYSIDGLMNGSANSGDVFWFGNMQAVFYPK